MIKRSNIVSTQKVGTLRCFTVRCIILNYIIKWKWSLFLEAHVVEVWLFILLGTNIFIILLSKVKVVDYYNTA